MGRKLLFDIIYVCCIINLIMVLQFLTWIKQEMALRPNNAAESAVSTALNELGPEYIVLNNLKLPTQGDSDNIQIDHVVVAPYGIFCVETYDCAGLIFVHKDYTKWSQIVGTTKSTIDNPLFQNYSKVQVLDRYITGSGIKVRQSIRLLIAFPFATKVMPSAADTVGDLSDILSKINSYDKKIYSIEEVDTITRWLRSSSRDALLSSTTQNSDLLALVKNSTTPK